MKTYVCVCVCVCMCMCMCVYIYIYGISLNSERPRRRWEDNIKMDLQKVGGGCGDWMELA